MRTLKVFAAVTAAILLLAGCTRGMKTASVADESFVPFQEGSEIGLSCDYNVEYVTGGVPAEVMAAINGTINYSVLYDAADPKMSVPEACRQWLEVSQAGYRDDVEDFREELEIAEDDEDRAWMFNWSYSVGGQFTTACKARGWQSYCASGSEYTGGAHGMYGETYYVFDLASGSRITEEDFLDMGRSDEITDLLEDSILKQLEEEDGMEDALFGRPKPNGNFSVSGEGVTWHYNPYEIAPYAMGVVGIELTWGQLEPYLL